MNKEMVNLAFETTLDTGLVMERRMFQVLTATEDKAMPRLRIFSSPVSICANRLSTSQQS